MNVGEAEMINRKKVIETLWDWHYRVPGGTDEYDALMDAIVLLKEQEVVEPFSDDNGGYWCSSCHEDIVWHQKFCSNCGRPVLWKGR